MKKTPVIEFNDFSFKYFAQSKPTLKNINLKIFAGEKILIVGPSGSGKSTMGNCLNGLIPFSY
ncbi:MAG: heme ABC transporter ATP-binding protein, partial [Spirochaetes bacterium]